MVKRIEDINFNDIRTIKISYHNNSIFRIQLDIDGHGVPVSNINLNTSAAETYGVLTITAAKEGNFKLGVIDKEFKFKTIDLHDNIIILNR
jgi:hypothetical protein